MWGAEAWEPGPGSSQVGIVPKAFPVAVPSVLRISGSLWRSREGCQCKLPLKMPERPGIPRAQSFYLGFLSKGRNREAHQTRACPQGSCSPLAWTLWQESMPPADPMLCSVHRPPLRCTHPCHQSQQVPHAPHGSGESPHLSSVSDICLASGPQMTQTHIFLSRHFPDRFPASSLVLLPWGERLAYTGPLGLLSGSRSHLCPHLHSPSCSVTAVLACLPLCPPRSWGAWWAEASVSSPGLEQRACCMERRRGSCGRRSESAS